MAICPSLCRSLSFLSLSTPIPISNNKSPPTQLTPLLPFSSFPQLSISSSPATTFSPTLKSKDIIVPILPDHDSFSCLSSDLLSVICPSVANSNTLFFKSGHYNVQVIVGEKEPEEKLVSRFRREVLRAGVIQECKRRRFFENPRDKKKRKSREAAKRNRKRRQQPRAPKQDKLELSGSKKDDDEDDNWEFVDVELTYC